MSTLTSTTSFQSPLTLRMRSQTTLPPIQTQSPIENEFYDCWSPLLMRRKSSRKKASALSSPSKPPYQSRFFEHLPGSVPPDLRASRMPKLLRHNSAPAITRARPRSRNPPSFARVVEEEGEVLADMRVGKEHAPLSEKAVNRAARSGSLALEVAAQKQVNQGLRETSRSGRRQTSNASVATAVSLDTGSKLSLAADMKAVDQDDGKALGRLRRATLQLKEKMRPNVDIRPVDQQHNT